MGGWADGIQTRELGTGLPTTMVWVGYRDSASWGLTTTLSIQEGEDQMWVEMDAEAWAALITHAVKALVELGKTS